MDENHSTPQLPELSDVQARILGCLMEKESTTPENYPLSLNATVRACNQKSNRNPVMELEEVTVRHALDRLTDLKLVRRVISDDSRVTKFRHIVPEVMQFGPPEVAVIAILLLRGPQTPGEIRNRTERLHDFASLPAVEASLEDLSKRHPSMVVRLERVPGARESRFAHLLGGPVDEEAPAVAVSIKPGIAPSPAPGIEEDRITRLESDVTELREQMEQLLKRFDDFTSQFG